LVSCYQIFQKAVGLLSPKRNQITGKWRKIHNEELSMYSSPNIIQLIKSTRIKWAGHVAHMGKRRGEAHAWFGWGNLRENDHLEEPGLDGRIILRWIFRKWDRVHGLD
jgi:hypothetical protein